MKKNKLMRFASVLVVAVLLSTCAISGTFAKYTSNTSGSDTARVAKWDFTVNSNGTPQSNTFAFDLFGGYTDPNVDTEGTGDEKVIAPGTTGSVQIVLTNLSEVVAKYAIDFSETKSDPCIPMEYSLNGTSWTTDINTLDIAASEEDDATNTELAFTGSTSKTITVYWRWAFETYKLTTDQTLVLDKTYYTSTGTVVQSPVVGDIATYYELQDAIDTNLGITGTATVQVTADVTVTQVD